MICSKIRRNGKTTQIVSASAKPVLLLFAPESTLRGLASKKLGNHLPLLS